MGMSDAVFKMATEYLKIWLRRKADEDGVVDLCGVLAIAREHKVGKNTATKMVNALKDEGFIVSVNHLHKPQIIIRVPGIPRQGIGVPRGGTGVPREGIPLKDSNYINGFQFKESSSSCEPAKNWREIESDDDDDHDRTFRALVHTVYRLEGRHAGELLPEAWLYFQVHFIEADVGPDRMTLLADLLPAWQDRWSKPDQMNFKPRLIRFLRDVVEGGKYGHPPT